MATLPLVLYVEDEDDNWMIAQLRLRQRYQLLRARNDQEACHVVREDGARLVAVLMDIQLKGAQLDGIQLTRLFKGRLSLPNLPPYARDCPLLQAPIFFVTAYGTSLPEEELRSAGADAVMTKPVNFAQLIAKLQGLGRSRDQGPG